MAWSGEGARQEMLVWLLMRLVPFLGLFQVSFGLFDVADGLDAEAAPVAAGVIQIVLGTLQLRQRALQLRRNVSIPGGRFGSLRKSTERGRMGRLLREGGDGRQRERQYHSAER